MNHGCEHVAVADMHMPVVRARDGNLLFTHPGEFNTARFRGATPPPVPGVTCGRRSVESALFRGHDLAGAVPRRAPAPVPDTPVARICWRKQCKD